MLPCKLCSPNVILGASKLSRRPKSTYLSSRSVRERFIDFFLQKGHSHIRSSSVKPYNDPTLEFVNAGMNQFKSVFLDITPSPALRATNSQKCIRIGGKHNDLNVVGHDSYHHTFFEMLGNWSFGDYFKERACEMAFELVTSPPYSLDPDRLYVTYFGGDLKLGLPPDIETKEIWEKIGINVKRILPFGIKDNFWEMGSSGPCGPCTELHYDHLGKAERPELVNRDLSDLTELWNIVFIQFNRQEDGSLKPLQSHFVDTGMGLERLVTLLQNKKSNYDTDLFGPLFDVISEVSGTRSYGGNFGSGDSAGIDTCYRIIADHARMIAVSISDNVLPEQSHGLRRVIRKALLEAEKLMPKDSVGLLFEVVKQVGITLHSAYPELDKNMEQVELVLKDEGSLWNSLQESVEKEWRKLLTLDPVLSKLSDSQSSGLISACKELHSYSLTCGETVSQKLALTFYDRYGLSTHLIEELCFLKGLKVDMKKLKIGIEALKETNKAALLSAANTRLTQHQLSLVTNKFRPTDDSEKFVCQRLATGEHEVQTIVSNVLVVFADGNILEKGNAVEWGTSIGLLTDRTNFWTSLKGDGDIGELILDDEEGGQAKVEVTKAFNYSGYILHLGKINPLSSNSKCLRAGDWKAEMKVDPVRRFSLMRNTSASHLLSHAVSSKLVNNVQSYTNTEKMFEIKYSIYGQSFTQKDALDIEKDVARMISDGVELNLSTLNVHDLSSQNIYVPPYINVQHGQMQLLSFSHKENSVREITLGPNVSNVKDIEQFCIIGCEVSSKNRDCILRAVTGPYVSEAIEIATRINTVMDSLPTLENADIDLELSKISDMLTYEIIPLRYREQLDIKFEEMSSSIKEQYRVKQELRVKSVLEDAREKGSKYVVYYVGENAKLEKLTRLCPELPILLFAYNKGHFTARCTVPREWQFTAEEWVGEVSKGIGGSTLPLKGHDSKRICTLKPIRLSKRRVDEVVEKAEALAYTAGDSFS